MTIATYLGNKRTYSPRSRAFPVTGHTDRETGVYVPGTVRELRALMRTWRDWGLDDTPEFAVWLARSAELRQ